ncbi:hypothetical protein Fmac_016577 [Flemingia macrophylla]|uniref:Uncharacterized protein n=1 Tax=Flemingia macrophylla TaxID=520843 RepID=A0ABD1MHU1_9FABA
MMNLLNTKKDDPNIRSMMNMPNTKKDDTKTRSMIRPRDLFGSISTMFKSKIQFVSED